MEGKRTDQDWYARARAFASRLLRRLLTREVQRIYNGSRFAVERIDWWTDEGKQSYHIRLLSGSWPAFWDLVALCSSDFTKDCHKDGWQPYGGAVKDLPSGAKLVTVMDDDRAEHPAPHLPID